MALRRQYRAVPEIVDYMNETCYGHEIAAIPKTTQRSSAIKAVGAIEKILELRSPIVLIDVESAAARTPRQSKICEGTIVPALHIVRRLVRDEGIDPSAIAYLSPYKDQLRLLRRGLDYVASRLLYSQRHSSLWK